MVFLSLVGTLTFVVSLGGRLTQLIFWGDIDNEMVV
jgi:hypothetical protein